MFGCQPGSGFVLSACTTLLQLQLFGGKRRETSPSNVQNLKKKTLQRHATDPSACHRAGEPET